MDRGRCWAIVQWVAKSQSNRACMHACHHVSFMHSWFYFSLKYKKNAWSIQKSWTIQEGIFFKGLLHRTLISMNQSGISLHRGGWGQRQEARERILVWDSNNLVTQVMTGSQASKPSFSQTANLNLFFNVSYNISAIRHLLRHQTGYRLKGWILKLC